MWLRLLDWFAGLVRPWLPPKRQRVAELSQREVLQPPAPSPEPSPEPTPEPTATVNPFLSVVPGNRAERRKLERARRRYDKFVKPKGPQPVKVERAAPAPQPPPQPAVAPAVEPTPALTISSANIGVTDHYDADSSQPKVLYEESEFYGEFNFRDTILDQLDRYWFYLARMKRRDPDAYGLYRQIGATVVPYMATGAFGKKPDARDKREAWTAEDFRKATYLPPAFNRDRPSFGCLVYGNRKIEAWEAEAKDGGHWPRFVYYNKCSKPSPKIQMMNGGDTYQVTAWFDDAELTKWGQPCEFAVFVSHDGRHIQLLRLLETKKRWVKKKHKPGGFLVPQRGWGIPDGYTSWARDHHTDAATYMAWLFCDAVMHQELTNYAMLRVAVRKGDLVASFGIDPRRMSYFFQDRDIELTEAGLRKRIFHVVRPHVRKDGVAVPMHFRGAKEFDWADYHVTVRVPGRDHRLLQEFDMGTIDEHWCEPDGNYIDGEGTGRMLAKHFGIG